MTANAWKARLARGLAVSPAFLLLGILVVVPIAFVVMAAFSSTTPRPGSGGSFTPSLHSFGILATGEALVALKNSLIVAAASSAAALVVGSLLAFVCARSNTPGRRFIYFTGIMPLFLPSYVGALAWVVIAGPSAGLVNVLFRDLGIDASINIYGLPGLAFVLAIYNAPYAFLLVHGALSMMNPDLEDAARTHGGSVFYMMRQVTFPLAFPALAGAGILVFALSIENFAVAAVLGTPGQLETLPTFIFRLMNSFPVRGNEAAAVAVSLSAVLIAATLLQRFLISRRSFTTISGKGMKAKPVDLGPWRWPALALASLYFLLAVAGPMLALILISLQKSQFFPSFTRLADPEVFSLRAFREVVTSDLLRAAAINSVVVSLSAAAVGVALGCYLAYTAYRTRLPGRGAAETLAMLPVAIPALVFGMGLLWTWLVLPIPIYGTIFVLIVAFVAHEAPQAFRGVASTILQTHRDLEDGAVMLGASRWKSVRYVTLPLMKVGLVSTFLLLLLLGMRELSAPLFLFTTDTRMLSIAIFDDLDNGLLQRAAATSVLYAVIIFVLSMLALRLGKVNFGDSR